MPGSTMPLGTWAGASSLHLSSGMAPGWPQRAQVRLNTHAGPGSYAGSGQHAPLPLTGGSGGFTAYEGPHAVPGVRQPFRRLPHSTQMRTPNLRYTSSSPGPGMAPCVPYDHFPGPGSYAMGKYSQFTGGYPGRVNGSAAMATLPKVQPYTSMRMERSSIRDVYPDKRCSIICRPNTNPGPAAYSPVPLMDRLRMSMSKSPLPQHLGGRARRGHDVAAFVASPTSLSSTLAELHSRKLCPPS